MKLTKVFFGFILLMFFAIFVNAEPFHSDEDIEGGSNNIYNFTEMNGTKFWQNGYAVLDTNSSINESNINQSKLNVNSSIYWDGETSQADLNVNSSDYWDNINNPFGIKISDLNQSGQSNLSVNTSNYWDNLDTPSDINAGDITDDGTYILSSAEGNLDVNSSIWWATLTGWSSEFFVSISNILNLNSTKLNETMDLRITNSEPNLNVNSSDYWDEYGIARDLDNKITLNASNITAGTFPGEEYKFPGNVVIGDNASTSSYFLGQPLDGSIGSGIIQSDGINSLGNLEINHTSPSLNLIYPDFVVRLVTSFNVVKYCNISSNTVATTNDQHSIFYIDGNCAINEASVETYINTPFSPGGVADFMNAMAHSSDVETHIGSTVLNKYDIKIRKNHFKTINLKVVNGMRIITETFPNYTQTEGEYSYVENILNSSEQNGSANATVEFVSHSGGAWYYNEQIGINLTDCDDGTNTVSCSNVNLYRRYVLCTTGYSDGTDTTELHQLAPLTTETFANVGNCLSIEQNPLTFTLPSQYLYTCVVNYVYCGRPVDIDWTGEFIDLRTTKTSAASAGFDTSQYLRKDGTVPLTADWYVDGFNIFDVLNLNVTDSVNSTRFFQEGNGVLDTQSGFGGDISGTNNSMIVNDDSHLLQWDNISLKQSVNVTTNFGGDVSGVYTNLQLGTDVVGDNELNTTEVTLNDFTNDANFIANDTSARLLNITTVKNIVFNSNNSEFIDNVSCLIIKGNTSEIHLC